MPEARFPRRLYAGSLAAGNLRYHVVGGGAARAYALLLGRPRPNLAPSPSEGYLRPIIEVVLRYLSAILAARSSGPVMPNLIGEVAAEVPANFIASGVPTVEEAPRCEIVNLATSSKRLIWREGLPWVVLKVAEAF